MIDGRPPPGFPSARGVKDAGLDAPLLQSEVDAAVPLGAPASLVVRVARRFVVKPPVAAPGLMRNLLTGPSVGVRVRSPEITARERERARPHATRGAPGEDGLEGPSLENHNVLSVALPLDEVIAYRPSSAASASSGSARGHRKRSRKNDRTEPDHEWSAVR